MMHYLSLQLMVLIIMAVLCALGASAGIANWRGSDSDSTWSNPQNWESFQVPGPTDVVQISCYNTGKSVVVIADVPVSVKAVNIGPQCTGGTSSRAMLKIHHNFSANGISATSHGHIHIGQYPSSSSGGGGPLHLTLPEGFASHGTTVFVGPAVLNGGNYVFEKSAKVRFGLNDTAVRNTAVVVFDAVTMSLDGTCTLSFICSGYQLSLVGATNLSTTAPVTVNSGNVVWVAPADSNPRSVIAINGTFTLQAASGQPTPTLTLSGLLEVILLSPTPVFDNSALELVNGAEFHVARSVQSFVLGPSTATTALNSDCASSLLVDHVPISGSGAMSLCSASNNVLRGNIFQQLRSLSITGQGQAISPVNSPFLTLDAGAVTNLAILHNPVIVLIGNLTVSGTFSIGGAWIYSGHMGNSGKIHHQIYVTGTTMMYQLDSEHPELYLGVHLEMSGGTVYFGSPATPTEVPTSAPTPAPTSGSSQEETSPHRRLENHPPHRLNRRLHGGVLKAKRQQQEQQHGTVITLAQSSHMLFVDTAMFMGSPSGVTIRSNGTQNPGTSAGLQVNSQCTLKIGFTVTFQDGVNVNIQAGTMDVGFGGFYPAAMVVAGEQTNFYAVELRLQSSQHFSRDSEYNHFSSKDANVTIGVADVAGSGQHISVAVHGSHGMPVIRCSPCYGLRAEAPLSMRIWTAWGSP